MRLSVDVAALAFLSHLLDVPRFGWAGKVVDIPFERRISPHEVVCKVEARNQVMAVFVDGGEHMGQHALVLSTTNEAPCGVMAALVVQPIPSALYVEP